MFESKKRRAALAVASALAAVSLAACSGGAAPAGSTSASGSAPAPAGDLSITFIPKQLNNPYTDVVTGRRQDRCHRCGLRQGAGGRPAGGVGVQPGLLHQRRNPGPHQRHRDRRQRPDAVCPALKEARDAGAKIVAFDSDTNPDCRDMFISQVVSKDVAQIQTKLISEQIGGSGKIAILSATANATNQNEWIKYMKEDLASNPAYKNIELVATVYGDDDDNKSFQEAQGLMQAHPDLKGIISPTTVGIAATARYLSTSQYKGKVALTGLGLPNEMRRSSRTAPSRSSRSGIRLNWATSRRSQPRHSSTARSPERSATSSPPVTWANERLRRAASSSWARRRSSTPTTSTSSTSDQPGGGPARRGHRHPTDAGEPMTSLTELLPQAAPQAADRLGLGWPRRVLAAVPRPAAAAAGIARRASPERFEALDAEVVDVGLHLRRAGGRRGRREAAGRGLRPDRRVLADHLPDRLDGAAGRPAGRRPGADHRPAADRAMDHATFDTGAVARLLRPVPGARGGQRLPPRPASRSARSPGWLEQDSAWARIEPLGARRRRPCAALRNARHGLMGHLYPGHARRVHRPDPGADDLRRARRGARVRRPAGAGRALSPTPRCASGWTSRGEIFTLDAR